MPNRATIDDVTRMFESVGVPVDPAGMAVVCSAGQQRSSWHVRVPADKVSAACSVKACGVNRINVVPEAQSFFDKALQRDGVSKHQWTVSLAGLPNNVSKGDVREFLERHGFESGSFSRVTVYSRKSGSVATLRLGSKEAALSAARDLDRQYMESSRRECTCVQASATV